MKKIFGRAWRGALLDRRAYAEAFWDNEATADGVIVVASVQAVIYLVAVIVTGAFSGGMILDLLGSVVSGVASWLILALAVWVSATKIFKAEGAIQTMMAMHGLAYLPTITAVIGIVSPSLSVVSAVGVVWYLAAVTVATREAASATTRIAVLSVIVGYALTALISAVFRFPFTTVSALSGLF